MLGGWEQGLKLNWDSTVGCGLYSLFKKVKIALSYVNNIKKKIRKKGEERVKRTWLGAGEKRAKRRVEREDLAASGWPVSLLHFLGETWGPMHAPSFPRAPVCRPR